MAKGSLFICTWAMGRGLLSYAYGKIMDMILFSCLGWMATRLNDRDVEADAYVWMCTTSKDFIVNKSTL